MIVLLLVFLMAASCAPRAAVAPAASLSAGTASVAHGKSSLAADAAAAGNPTAEVLLEANRTVAGEAFRYPSSPLPQVVAQIVTIKPGQTTGWHRHGVPMFGYILSGTVDVEYDGLGHRRLGPGDRLMEAMTVAHNGANLGTEDVRILVVLMGAQGTSSVMKAEPPSMPADLGGSRRAELVDLATVDPGIRLDLRYASADNFTGRAIYREARAFLQRPAAEALRRANERARAEGYGLLVLDAYRPWSVTRLFWDGFPMHRAYLADPLQGSRHNRGCAVDLTLFDLATGAEVRMPSGYDDFSERAHPHYAGGEASERAARDLLRRLMEAEGFTVYENEWWHFDHDGWEDYPVLDLPFEAVAPSPPR